MTFRYEMNIVVDSIISVLKSEFGKKTPFTKSKRLKTLISGTCFQSFIQGSVEVSIRNYMH